ncbi:MAG TPA: dihydropyrimidinase, partial [Sinorhizobium sp.]|nr:dihydropyrimidinase [Sinorhizobium sp.]
VIPGGIDPHTHLEMPFMGTTAAETFESGTFAAASGGTTMLVDFVLPGPDGSLLTALDEWDRKAKPQICVDIGYHMAITGWNEKIWHEMDAVVKRGVNTFKHFMAYKGALMVDDDEMFSSFQRCAALGALPLVHAENGDVVAQLQAKLLAEGNNGPEAHAYSRPAEVEGEAANRAIMIADMAGCPVYIVHTSCEQAHEAIRRARAKGMRVFGEPLIQHLTLDESEYFDKDWDHAARRVMSPPFRNKLHQDSLWAGLASGSLQVVATDHCAFTTAQKRFGVGDFTKIPNGTGGLEDRMPMLWTYGVNTGRITMNEFVAVTSTNIAKILNIYPKKGAILVGADADLVVWDPKRSKTITANTQQSAIDYNVFEGKTVTGLPRFTLTRGVVAIEEGAVKTREGHGEFVRRDPFPAVSTALSTWKEVTAPRAVQRTGIPASGV